MLAQPYTWPVGKTATSLPLLALASAAWVVVLAGLAIAESKGMAKSNCLDRVLVLVYSTCVGFCEIFERLVW